MKKWIYSFSLILFFSIISCSDNNVNNYEPPSGTLEGILVGQAAPNITVNDITGKPINLHSLRGNVVLLDFWATWCYPCKQEIPKLKEIWEKYHGKNFVIIGISSDTKVENLKSYVEQNEIKWQQYFDATKSVYFKYVVNAIPRFYLIRKNGIISFTGYPVQINLENEIDKLLKE